MRQTSPGVARPRVAPSRPPSAMPPGDAIRTRLDADARSTRIVVSPTSRPRSMRSAGARVTGALAGAGAGGLLLVAGGAAIGVGTRIGSGAGTAVVHDKTSATMVVPSTSAGRRRSATNLPHGFVEASERRVDVGIGVRVRHERGLERRRREIDAARERRMKESL